MTIIQDLELGEVIAGDIQGFAAGNVQPFGPTTVSGVTVSGSVQVLLNGPVAPFQTFTGSLFGIILLILQDAGAIASGTPLSIAFKVNKTWYGVALTAKL